jgi:predicted permease
MDTILNDLRVALRQHARQRGFAMTVLLTLALAIGATTAVFSVVNAVLVRGLPYGSPEQLVWVASLRPDNANAPFTLPEYMDYRSQTRTLSGLAAYANWSASLAGEGITERLTGARMSANAFEVLDLAPVAGRLLDDTDDRADADPVVVISHRLWQRRFGGQPDAVGKTVRINSTSYLIAGVMPAHFPLPLFDIDVVTALQPDRDPLRHVRGSVNFLRFIGRLNDGTTAAQAQAELTTICRSLREQFPVEYARKEAVKATALQEVLVGDHRQSMLVLLAAVIVVLGTALANLFSLALVRANARRAELITRVAIGASRWHLARQLTVEMLVLAVIGTALGFAVATPAIAAVRVWAPATVPRLGEVSLDVTVVLFAMGVTLVVTTLLTIAPLTVVAGTRAGDVLRSSRGSIGDRWNQRTRHALVVSEISAALVLLLATLVLVEGLRQLNAVPLGFDPGGVFQARVSVPPAYRSPDAVARFYDRLAERLIAAPGVDRLGVISVAPLSGLLATVPFTVEGQTAERGSPMANLRAISPGYLGTVGTRLLEGRGVEETDRANTPHVGLVSAALADRFFGGNAVGQRLLINDNNQGPRPIEIVGVVENVRQAALDLPPALDIYLPLRQIHQDGVGLLRNNHFWMLKTRSDPAAFRATFLTHLREVDPDAAVSGEGTMGQFVDAWLGPRRFNLGLFGAFAVTSILLAVSGLYGLVAYAVSQRAREIGVRMAIGATARDVLLMILRQAATLGLVGALFGLLIAGAARPLIVGMIGDVQLGPFVIGVTTSVLIAVVLVAAWVPARRAAQVEPVLALKEQ